MLSHTVQHPSPCQQPSHHNGRTPKNADSSCIIHFREFMIASLFIHRVPCGNDQKLSHTAGDIRQPEIRSENGQA